MMQQPPKAPSTRWLTSGALIATGLYVLGIAAVATCRWNEISVMDLEKLATALSGALSPLALAWLVVGYFQQGIELKLNTQALQLQARELASSVEEQKSLNDHQRVLAEVAQQQLSAELERSRLDRDHARRQIASNISYQGDARNVYSPSKTRHIFGFTNMGRTAHAVDIRLTPECDDFGPTRIDVWNENAQVLFSLFHPRDIPPPQPLKLRFTYNDALGIGETKEYLLVAGMNEKGVTLTPVWIPPLPATPYPPAYQAPPHAGGAASSSPTAAA